MLMNITIFYEFASEFYGIGKKCKLDPVPIIVSFFAVIIYFIFDGFLWFVVKYNSSFISNIFLMLVQHNRYCASNNTNYDKSNVEIFYDERKIVISFQ